MPSGAMGRRGRDENHSPQQYDLIEDSDGKKENGYPAPDDNKTMTNDTKKHKNAQKNTLKGEILKEMTGNFMKKILDMDNQNVEDTLKKFQDTKNKEHDKTQKQIKELKPS
jgi:hypothetical protein